MSDRLENGGHIAVAVEPPTGEHYSCTREWGVPRPGSLIKFDRNEFVRAEAAAESQEGE